VPGHDQLVALQIEPFQLERDPRTLRHALRPTQRDRRSNRVIVRTQLSETVATAL
jgi:hypothetical protein